MAELYLQPPRVVFVKASRLVFEGAEVGQYLAGWMLVGVLS